MPAATPSAASPPAAAAMLPAGAGYSRGIAGFLPRGFSRLDALGVVAIALLIGVGYYPALQGAFVWDDVIFSEEPVIHAASGLWSIWFSPADIRNEGHYWPIVYTTFYLEHKLWGLAPVGYHAVNLLLHFVNALLVWRLMGRLTVPGAWLIAAVFAAHPLHVESVAWIIERKDLLSAMFYLTAMMTWMRFVDEGTKRHYLLALGLFTAGLLSKSVVVTLPATLLIWHWWREGRVTIADIVRLAPLFAVGFAITLADFAFYTSRESLDLGYSIAERMLIAGRALWFYLGKLVWPVDLAVIYPQWEIDTGDLLAWAFVIAAVALAAALWFSRRWTDRGPLAGALAFAVTLAPVLGFIDYGYMQFSFVADRFQYLAGIGVMAVLIGSAARATRTLPPAGQTGARTAAGAALAILAVLTWQQAGVYRDEVALFSHVVSLNPNARDAHLNLGSALLTAGRTEEGLVASRIAVEQRPDTPGPYTNLGRALQGQGRFEESEEQLRRALEVDPRHLSALQNLAELYRKQGNFAQAIEAYRAVLAIQQDYALAHAGLGHTLYTIDRHEEAIEAMERALALRPELPMAGGLQIVMGQAARKLGQFDRADAYLRRAMAIQPRKIEPLLELAELRSLEGRHEAAEAYRRRARELHPNNPAALHTVAESLRKGGRTEEAIAAYQEVFAIDPDSAPAHAGLGMAYHQSKRHEEAVRNMERALELQPDLAVAATLRVFIGHSLLELDRPEAADEQYRLALDVDPRNADALDHLAMSRFGEKRYEEARKLYVRLADVQPNSAVTHSNLGAVLHHLGRNEEALASVERALALDPDLELARVGRREVRKALGLDAP